MRELTGHELGQIRKELEECEEGFKEITSALAISQDKLLLLLSSVETVYKRSLRLYASATNRNAVSEKLDWIFQQLNVESDLKEKLFSGPIDVDNFQTALITLDRLADRASSDGDGVLSFRNMLIAQEALSEFKGLFKVAFSRFASHIKNHLDSLGPATSSKSLSNLHALRASKFARLAESFRIVFKRNPELAADIAKHYTDTASLYHLHRLEDAFKLMAVKKIVLGKASQYMLGSWEASNYTASSRRISLFTKGNPKPPKLSNRSSVSVGGLQCSSNTEMTSSFQVTFVLLCEIIRSECSFLGDFFQGTFHQDRLLEGVLEKTIEFFKIGWSEKLQVCFDLVELTGLLAASQETASELLAGLEERKARGYGEEIVELILGRINLVINAQISSLSEGSDKKNLFSDDVKVVCPITRKYSDLLCQILAGCPADNPHPKLIDSLNRMMNAFDNFLQSFKESHSIQIFLINNYDHIVSMLEHNTDHKKPSSSLFHSQLCQQYEGRLNDAINAMVVEGDLLMTYFPFLFGYLQHLELEGTDDSSNTEKIDQIIADFNGNVSKRIQQITGDLVRSFCNLRTTQTVLGVVWVQLISAYEHFLSHLDRVHGKEPMLNSNPMSVDALRSLIKKEQNQTK